MKPSRNKALEKSLLRPLRNKHGHIPSIAGLQNLYIFMENDFLRGAVLLPHIEGAHVFPPTLASYLSQRRQPSQL